MSDQPFNHTSSASATGDWWTSFFDDAYAAYGLTHDPPEVLEKTVDFLMKALDLRAGQIVFEQCSGIGRLSIPLAKRGVRVIGVELADSYVTAARRRAAEHNLPCEFHRGDALEFVAPMKCDVAFNWFTSFGYHQDDAINAKMLQRAIESLKPGGRFALDYLHVPRVLAEFRQWYIDRPTAPGLEGLIVLHETQSDFMAGMINSRWTFLYPDNRRVERDIATRMLLPSDFVRMFRQTGFENIELFGSVEGEPLGRLSKRCIIVGSKPR